MERTYQVTYACDFLDPKPVVKTFDLFDEMQDWITEEVEQRVQWFVDHSPYSISEKERSDQEQVEYSLVQIKEI
tara:strand:+ start:214 stop:435 length:222 start_codon:yes stop_codon:yes gene_type:complete